MLVEGYTYCTGMTYMTQMTRYLSRHAYPNSDKSCYTVIIFGLKRKYFWPQKGTFWAKTGPFGAPGGPEEGRDQAKVCGNHEFNPSGAAGGS